MSSPSPTAPTSGRGSPRIAAVVLTGGAGLRLGGVEKAALEIRGTTLLGRALEATALADEVVVVGKDLPTARAVMWTRESPLGGGPAAGLLAGIDALGTQPDVVCVLAVDMPGVAASTFDRLVASLSADAELDAAVLLDAAGRRQMLAGAYRHSALSKARPVDRSLEHGLSMRSLIAELRIREIPGVADEAHDVDTWEDLKAFRERP